MNLCGCILFLSQYTKLFPLRLIAIDKRRDYATWCHTTSPTTPHPRGPHHSQYLSLMPPNLQRWRHRARHVTSCLRFSVLTSADSVCVMCRLAEIMIPQFNQPAVRAIRVLRPLKLVTGFESKYPFTTSAEASHLSVVSTPITWIPARVEPNAIYTYTYPKLPVHWITQYCVHVHVRAI